MPNYGPTMDEVLVVLGERSHENSVDYIAEPNEIYVNIIGLQEAVA